jgi:hypothetical protein
MARKILATIGVVFIIVVLVVVAFKELPLLG